VEIAVEGELVTAGPTAGMILDFADLKGAAQDLVDSLDHSFMYQRGSLPKKVEKWLNKEGMKTCPTSFVPTAENLAIYFYEQLAESIPKIVRVTIWETPTSWASFQP